MFNLRFLIDIVGPALLACWAVLFIYKAAAGQSGFGALSVLEDEVEVKAAEVEALRERRMALEKHANQLNSKSLDSDLAEERIRSVLGYTREGDIVVSREELEKALADRGQRR